MTSSPNDRIVLTAFRNFLYMSFVAFGAKVPFATVAIIRPIRVTATNLLIVMSLQSFFLNYHEDFNKKVRVYMCLCVCVRDRRTDKDTNTEKKHILLAGNILLYGSL